MSTSTRLREILDGRAGAYALLHRPYSADPDSVTVLTGAHVVVDRLSRLPTPGPNGLLLALPFRQVAERGFACVDDGTPLLAIDIGRRTRVGVAEVRRCLPAEPPRLVGGGFDIGDDEYADIVRTVVKDEIGRGEGSNFVIRRTFRAGIADHSHRTGLAAFRRLLETETGAYWTFLVHVGGRTLVGATPERHVALRDGVAVMSPISGTYRYPPTGPDRADLLRFLADRKETDELHMVVDEELKMMGRLCPGGGRLRGPWLSEMARLAHTGYVIEGRTGLDVRDVLRLTMFAPTVTGSPLENACRVIARHERRGRGYYAGAIALVGWRRGRPALDSAITIRAADIDQRGRLAIGVGATLVRSSDPDAEVAETRAKVDSLLGAFGAAPPVPAPAGPRLGADPRVRRALAARNGPLAAFWFAPDRKRRVAVHELRGRRVLVVDAEDRFTAMLANQIRALGPQVLVRPHDSFVDVRGADVVIVGPGPGDPRDLRDSRIAALRALTRRLLIGGTPLLSVCLGHQVLAGLLGLAVRRMPTPAQGLQRDIDYFGRRERVGCYHTFAAYSDADVVMPALLAEPVRVSRDRVTGEVYGLRASRLRSAQFHPESVLTERGPELWREMLTALCPPAPRGGCGMTGHVVQLASSLKRPVDPSR
jgi:phenazine biosynthesis protein phzE